MGCIGSYLLDIVHAHKDSLAPLIEDGQLLRKLVLVYRGQRHLSARELVLLALHWKLKPKEVIHVTCTKRELRQHNKLHNFCVAACLPGHTIFTPALPPLRSGERSFPSEAGTSCSWLLNKYRGSILKQMWSLHDAWGLVCCSKISSYLPDSYSATSAFSADRFLCLFKAVQIFYGQNCVSRPGKAICRISVCHIAVKCTAAALGKKAATT